MIKFFKEFQKPYFEPILGPFAKFGAKMNFPGKKRLCHSLNVRMTYQRAKNQKNLMSHS